MNEFFERLRNYGSSAIDRYRELWEESLTTKIVSISIAVFAVILVLWFSISSFFFTKKSEVPQSQGTSQAEQNAARFEQLKFKTEIGTNGKPLVFGLGNALTLDNDIRTSLKEIGPTSAVIETLQLGGTIPDLQNPESNIFVKHIELLRSMRNYTKISVIHLMQESSDRANTLNQLLVEMTDQVKLGQNSIAELREEIGSLQNEQKIHEGMRNEANKSYNSAITNFDAGETYRTIMESIKEQNLSTELNIKIKALQKFTSIYESILKILTVKIRFVTANRDGLVKGVVVVDVKGSQEDLILSEDEWKKLISQ